MQRGIFLANALLVLIAAMPTADSWGLNDSFERGINPIIWNNSGWATDLERGHCLKSSMHEQEYSNISTIVTYPCVVSFKGKIMYPGSQLTLLDNDSFTGTSIIDPMINGWTEDLYYSIGTQYSIITENFRHELKWAGVRATWLDDVRIQCLPFVRFKEVRVIPNGTTSDRKFFFYAEIESPLSGFDVTLFVLPPDTSLNQEKSYEVQKYQGTPLRWGPIRLNCTSCGMGQFWFNVGSPFNSSSKLYSGPNIIVCKLNQRSNCSCNTGSDCCTYCVDVISCIDARIQLSGFNNSSQSWLPFYNCSVGRDRGIVPICAHDGVWDEFRFDIWNL